MHPNYSKMDSHQLNKINGDKMQTTIENGKFLIDGKDFRILSGEMHYFRVPREYWRDRLEKLKACGLNTVATYMPWNLHERIPGKFDFSGNLDVAEFLEIADSLNIKVILRPGPYICSEWDFGGLPAWLPVIEKMHIRCSDPVYLKYVRRFFEAAFDVVRKYFTKNIILLQIENGYASFGNDRKYMIYLKELVEKLGYPNVISTADGDSDTRINSCSPAGVWQTLMGDGAGLINQLKTRRQEGYPQLVIEYWNGRTTKVGRVPREQEPEVVAEYLRRALELGAHINLYMFHGGTNFGFMEGSEDEITLQTTSYDALAPLSESGEPTELYMRFQNVLAEYNPEFDLNKPVPQSLPKKSYGKIEFTGFAPLAENFDALDVKKQESIFPLTMEEAGGDFGFVHYRTRLEKQTFPLPIRIDGYSDSGIAMFDGKTVAKFGRNNANFTVPVPEGGILDIVIENAGRIHFWPKMAQVFHKGIFGGVVLNNQQFQLNWTTSPMPMNDLSKLKFGALPEFPSLEPGFYRAEFEVDEPADTFVKLLTATHGFCVINGFILGRFDKSGPFHHLYLPAPLLRKGKNELILFEMNRMEMPFVKLEINI